MATIDPWHVKIDGEVMGTYAKAIEDLDGLESLPGRRVREQYAAGVDGSWPAPAAGPAMFQEKRQRLRIWVSPFDADGAVTYANGPRAHLRENLDDLYRIIAGTSRSAHTIQWIVPTPTGTITLENTARITTPIRAAAGSRLVRRFDIELVYPWPFFRDITTGLQTLGPFTGSQSFTPQGTAPLADMVLTCTSAGTITHDETGEAITAEAGFTTALVIDQRPPRSITHAGGASDGRAYYNPTHTHGLRFDAGVQANLTMTGTWQLDYYPQHH